MGHYCWLLFSMKYMERNIAQLDIHGVSAKVLIIVWFVLPMKNHLEKTLCVFSFTKSCLQSICCSLIVCNVIMLTIEYFINVLCKDICNLSFMFYSCTVTFTILWWNIPICYWWHLSMWANVMCKALCCFKTTPLMYSCCTNQMRT
jgi:hypothetical protein